MNGWESTPFKWISAVSHSTNTHTHNPETLPHEVYWRELKFVLVRCEEKGPLCCAYAIQLRCILTSVGFSRRHSAFSIHSSASLFKSICVLPLSFPLPYTMRFCLLGETYLSSPGGWRTSLCQLTIDCCNHGNSSAQYQKKVHFILTSSFPHDLSFIT